MMERLRKRLGIGASKEDHKKLNAVIGQQAEYITKLEAENSRLWDHCSNIGKFPPWYVQGVIDSMENELKGTEVIGLKRPKPDKGNIHE